MLLMGYHKQHPLTSRAPEYIAVSPMKPINESVHNVAFDSVQTSGPRPIDSNDVWNHQHTCYVILRTCEE